MVTRRNALAGFTVLTSGCIQPDKLLRGNQQVTIGGSLPLSGPLKRIGVPLHRGLRLWIRAVNETDGFLGRTVTLDIVDDQGKPDVATEAYRTLVDDSQFLVSPYGSRVTDAVIGLIEDAGVPCIAHTAGDRNLWTPGREWTVQLLNPIDTFLHPPLGAAAQQGARSVAFIYRDDGFTPTTMEGAMEKARQADWTNSDTVTYNSTSELAEGMQRVVAESPDFVVGSGFQPGKAGGGFLPDALALSRAYSRTASAVDLVCWSIGAAFPEFANRVGEQAELATGVTGWKPYIDYPGNSSFISRYTERWDGPPDSHAAQGFATGQLFEAAAEEAGTLERSALRDALFALQTETVFGRYRVNERGLQTGKENVVIQWQDGDPIVVWPKRWKAGDLIYGK